MSDIRNQLIKDSYNYVLQSDLSTGVVYRIGGDIPVNPIFQSGLTINSGFTYSNGTEQLGYVMTCDAFGNANWAPASAATPSSGVTSITVGNGLSANSSTGAVTIVFTGSTSFSGDYLPLSGGTLTGGLVANSGVTANTISATTYYNLPTDVFVTGGTYTSGEIIFTNNTGGTFNVSGFAVGGGGGQIFYLNLSQSQGSNRLLSTTGSTASEQSTGVTINNGVTGTIASFQSQPLNTTLLPGGIWSFYLHSYKQNNNASFNIFVEVYKRTSGGTQTLLFTTDPAPVTTNSPNPSMQLSDGYFSGTPLSVSDSIVAVVRATNTSNQSHIITLVSEGSQHYSYVVSTIPTQQGLTCDTLSGCSIIQTIQTDVSNKLDKSGGTITGNLIINSGLTATTVSATTYYNLPVSGLTPSTYITTTPNNGNYTIALTGPLLSYYVSGSTPGGTQVSGDRWLDTNTGDELVWVDDGDSQQWIQIASVVGGGGGSSTSTGVTFIASSNCLILSDANTYIGYSKGGGWSYFAWDVENVSFSYDNVDCGIPIPENIVEGQTINVCGVAYSAGLGSESLRLKISKLSCSDLSVIPSVYTSDNQIFDSNGNLCFSFDYVVGSGEDFIKCSDFIVLGFQGGSTENSIKISYKITAS